MLANLPDPNDADLCHIICCSQEFENVRVRAEELREVDDLKKKSCANAAAALRLRKLLCPFSRPKLIFGGGSSSSSAENEEESIVRVSCAKYTGFD
mmetsp:Transcript_26067/g.33207  ORF Transcript_26067/g.33207 Transcript_26067/m.33207 type:complete len:96 (+) Transcript_26067:1814-2101(+)